jgi:putative intracellular protease/amidase
MKAYLYLLNTLADWEVGFITSELHSGRYLDKTKDPVPLIKIGNTKQPITTMGGISVSPDETIDNIRFNDGDILILPGGDTWMDESNRKILDIVSKLSETKVTIAAICGATFALAKQGLLNERKHTSNDLGFLKMICPDYKGENHYMNDPAVVDGNLITATGLAPLEFAYEIFKKTEVMKKNTVEAWFQLYKTRDAKYFYQLMDSLK